MKRNLLKSLSAYSNFIINTLNRPTIKRHTLTVWPISKYTGVAEGEVFFTKNYRLRLREELDFDAGLITSYGYEVYLGDEKLYWYDDFPHPDDSKIASTYPHHKHISPDIKHNRVPAPNIEFCRPNLPGLIEEIENLMQ